MAFATEQQVQVAQIIFEKDYYRILGVTATATPEQIKESYRKLAKKYHPDSRAAGADKTDYSPDSDMFRDVNEAYQILSVLDSRVNYDLKRKRNPDAFKPMSVHDFNLENRIDLRDKGGIVSDGKPKRGSYEEERLDQLKKDRAKYNVNHLGYYRGGVPQKDMGAIRRKSMGNPGEFHSPQLHNFLNYNHQDASFLNQEDAIKFKHWMNSDIVDYQKSKPYYPMYYDRNMEFMKDRSFWLVSPSLISKLHIPFFRLIYNLMIGILGFRVSFSLRLVCFRQRAEEMVDVGPQRESKRSACSSFQQQRRCAFLEAILRLREVPHQSELNHELVQEFLPPRVHGVSTRVTLFNTSFSLHMAIS